MVGRGESVDQLEQRLRAGEWLTAGLIAKVLGIGRTTFHDWLETGHTPDGVALPYRRVGRYRKVDPEAALAALTKHRQIHGPSN